MIISEDFIPLLLPSSRSDGYRKEVIFEWPKHMNINYFYSTNRCRGTLLLLKLIKWYVMCCIIRTIYKFHRSKFELCKVIRRWPPWDARQTLTTIAEVTLAPVAKLSLPVLTIKVCHDRGSNPISRMRG